MNQNRRADDLEVKVIFKVLPFESLLPALIEGRGNIAAAGLTITDKRLKKVAFTRPYLTDISEVLVTGPHVDDILSLEDLYGRTIHVLSGSSYVSHLERLNRLSLRRWRPTMPAPPASAACADRRRRRVWTPTGGFSTWNMWPGNLSAGKPCRT